MSDRNIYGDIPESALITRYSFPGILNQEHFLSA